MAAWGWAGSKRPKWVKVSAHYQPETEEGMPVYTGMRKAGVVVDFSE